MVKEGTRAELSREAEVNSQAKVLGSEGRPCVEPKEMRTSYTHSRCIMRIAAPRNSAELASIAVFSFDSFCCRDGRVQTLNKASRGSQHCPLGQ